MAPVKRKRSSAGTTIVRVADLPKGKKSTIIKQLGKKVTKHKKTKSAAKKTIHGVDVQSITKKMRKVKKRPEDKLIKKGVQFTRELGGVLNDGQGTLFCGHSTTAVNTMRLFSWCALFKKLMLAAGQEVPALNFSFPSINGNDFIQLRWRLAADDATTTSNTAISACGTTVLDIASYFNDPIRPWNGTRYETAQMIVFDAIFYIPEKTAAAVGQEFLQTRPARIILNNAKVTFMIKQQMKVQNRSVAEAGDDEVTRVDNVPLYMHIYGRTGNSFEYIQKQSAVEQAFVVTAEPYDGLIQPQNAPFAREPPAPKELASKYYKKKILEPGAIEESRLYFKKTMYWNNLMGYLGVSDPAGNPSRNRKIFGQCRLFAFDKMIETLNRATRLPIKIAYEINTFGAMDVTGGYNNSTTQLYQFNGAAESG